MKKLIALAAVAACGAAIAAVESPNIVGYQTDGAAVNLSAHVLPFAPIGDTGIDLQSIVPTVASGTLKSGDFVIQYYNQYGVLDHAYYYLLAPDTDEEETDGWWDDQDGVTYSTKTFEPGEGFWVNAKVQGSLVFPALSL